VDKADRIGARNRFIRLSRPYAVAAIFPVPVPIFGTVTRWPATVNVTLRSSRSGTAISNQIVAQYQCPFVDPGKEMGSSRATSAAPPEGRDQMFIKKVPVQERERWRVLQERSAGNGQPYAIAMSGWDSASPLHQLVTKAFMRALANDSKLPQAIRDIVGMSGQTYRSFINNLVESCPDARYLEIGSWQGSTAAAALYGNAAKCVCIDNWSQFGGPKEGVLRQYCGRTFG
jgi:hypothetical protein